MATDLLEKPRTYDGDTGADDIVHGWCHCDPSETLCGIKMEVGELLDEEVELDCVVCADLYIVPCQKCRCISK